ncbi:hypothetical protein M2191_004459 [Bradyrhizobium japonicum]|nr:hypothetical protein [Bradyrhizobium japonicum]
MSAITKSWCAQHGLLIFRKRPKATWLNPFYTTIEYRGMGAISYFTPKSIFIWTRYKSPTWAAPSVVATKLGANQVIAIDSLPEGLGERDPQIFRLAAGITGR